MLLDRKRSYGFLGITKRKTRASKAWGVAREFLFSGNAKIVCGKRRGDSEPRRREIYSFPKEFTWNLAEMRSNGAAF